MRFLYIFRSLAIRFCKGTTKLQKIIDICKFLCNFSQKNVNFFLSIPSLASLLPPHLSLILVRYGLFPLINKREQAWFLK